MIHPSSNTATIVATNVPPSSIEEEEDDAFTCFTGFETIKASNVSSLESLGEQPQAVSVMKQRQSGHRRP